jgi:hypothetical protein
MITVEAIGTKFNGSVKSGGEWFNISPRATVNGEKLTPDYFEKGQSYNVSLYVSEAGKKYINGIAGEESPKQAIVKGVDAAPKATAPAKDDDYMSKEDWTAKDKRISKQGLLQNALEQVIRGGYKPTLDEAKELALDTARWAFKQVWGEEWK